MNFKDKKKNIVEAIKKYGDLNRTSLSNILHMSYYQVWICLSEMEYDGIVEKKYNWNGTRVSFKLKEEKKDGKVSNKS